MIQDIQPTLISAYESGGFALPTAHENVEFMRTEGNPWASVFYIPNQPSVATVSGTGEDEHDGIFQIDLNYPYNEGNAAIRAKAGVIAAFFQAGKKFTNNGQEITIVSCGISRGRRVDADHRVSVTLSWTARTQRSL